MPRYYFTTTSLSNPQYKTGQVFLASLVRILQTPTRFVPGQNRRLLLYSQLLLQILHDFLLSEEQKAEEIEDDTAFAEFCMNIHAL